MVRKFKKHSYSLSFSEKMINNLRYYMHTHQDEKLSQQVEKYLTAIIPEYKP